MSDRSHQHDIVASLVAIERHITALTIGSEELPQSILAETAKQWMLLY
jgi:hypothetical protein